MTISRVVAAAVLGLALASCADDGGDVAPAAEPALPQGSAATELSPADLSTTIDNEFFPLKPGTRWTYEELEDGAVLRVVVTATSVTKKLADGSTALVVRDTVTEDGEVVEDTFDWYAQDGDGNVWYLGEDTAEFEDGKISSRDGAWESGVDGALPGVIMPAEPAIGQRYRQEYFEGEAEDNGEVLSVSEMADVAAGHYDGLVLTKDTIALEPDVLEYKLYAPDVGNVLTLGISGGVGREELVRTETVSAAAAQSAGTTPLGKPYD
jgi:hypothetical protein